MIIFLCIIACVVIYLVLQFTGEKGDSYRKTPSKTTSNSNYAPKIVGDSYFSENDIINSVSFQRCLNEMKEISKWMTLAGGKPPLPPIVKSEGNLIVLEKKGYDVDLSWYKKYMNGTVWGDREFALEMFFHALFKEYAEEVRTIVNIEHIADQYIEFEDVDSNFESDFILKGEVFAYNLPEWGKDLRWVLGLYARELYKWIDTYYESIREK